MEDAFYETTICVRSRVCIWIGIFDEATVLNFSRLLEKGELASGILWVPPIVRDQECQCREPDSIFGGQI
ncbi:hypothetical protein EMIT0P171_20173 [Pseudomonas sp. IT-P171]